MNNVRLTTMFSILLIVIMSGAYPCHALDIEALDDILYPQSEKKISMDFTNAKLNNVLKIFSQQSGLNFVVASEISENLVDIYLDQVPVEDALEQILAANNLSYEIDPISNIFIVSPKIDIPLQLMTRVYPLKFATVPNSKINTTLSPDEDGATTSTVDLKDLGITAAVEALLSDDGRIVEDIRTNSIIVSDIPSQFPLIEQTITRLDVRIPQILIEAEMLDISSNTSKEMGIKFGNTTSTDWLRVTGASRNHTYPFNNNTKLEADSGFEKILSSGNISFAGLDMVLNFLRTKSDTKNLARPRILTLNNNTAEIAITKDEAIGETDSQSSGGSITTQVTGEAEREETGVFLKVTPQANIQTREIKIAVEPRVLEAKRSVEFPAFKDVEERGTKSIFRVNDGDTIVIGGLLKTDLQHDKTKLPIISDIPIIGAPFRHKIKTETTRELIIFITPHILDEQVAFNKRSNIKQQIVREQSVPTAKSIAVDKDLSYIEKRSNR